MLIKYFCTIIDNFFIASKHKKRRSNDIYVDDDFVISAIDEWFIDTRSALIEDGQVIVATDGKLGEASFC